MFGKDLEITRRHGLQGLNALEVGIGPLCDPRSKFELLASILRFGRTPVKYVEAANPGPIDRIFAVGRSPSALGNFGAAFDPKRTSTACLPRPI